MVYKTAFSCVCSDNLIDGCLEWALKLWVTISIPVSSSICCPSSNKCCCCWSSESVTKLDQLQLRGYCLRGPPPLFSYHNDLTAATGRSWDAVVHSPRGALTAEYGKCTQTQISHTHTKRWRFHAVRNSYTQLGWSVNLICESPERWEVDP